MLKCPNCGSSLASGHPCFIELPSMPLGGASQAFGCLVLFVAKRNSDRFPWSVVNDRVGGAVGRLLGMPVPDTILYRYTDEWVFFSHYVGQPPATEGDTPPPTHTLSDRLEAVLQSDSTRELRHGVVLYDLLIANNDRKADNIVLGVDGRPWLIDQANSLFYRPYRVDGADRPCGAARLAAVASDPRAMFDKTHHCLHWLTDWGLVHRWCDRIAQIPDWQLGNVVGEVPDDLLPKPEADALVEFLMARKGRMLDIVRSCQDLFKHLPPEH